MKALVAALIFSFITLPALAGEARTAITFATDWKAQAEHGGFYQALAKGYYRDAGLDVTIRPGGPQVDLPRLMAAGALDVVMASNGFQPYNLAAAGVPVKVLMASFQKDPQVLMVHPDVPAAEIADLKGRPIFISDSAISTFWPWLKARFAFEDKQIRKYGYSLGPWLANPGSVQEGYLSSEPYSATIAGIEPKVFLFADAGYPGYAAMVMVRDDYLKDHEAAMRAFVQASIRGWQDYIHGDPAAGNALILKDNREMTPELLAYAVKAMHERGIVGEGDIVGTMTAERWAQFYREMSELGILPKGLDPASVYRLDFTRP
ncbi:ABC transporter substrate-binding protein [Pseudokordiimonas caeni]|uniref:ABC transporter substrate-binding protein n=1 Tax=Pseudokordiimonas caeni TaxID=2997908 RepID=UPI002811175F|nr:ABC transporter substrate-binding protein [Pseudokordiimonas caeni]